VCGRGETDERTDTDKIDRQIEDKETSEFGLRGVYW